MNRILWNQRPVSTLAAGGNIDEIVLHAVDTVHVEQMDGRCWWIALYRADGTYWMGNFVADSRGRMQFREQENAGIEWERDDTHGAA